MNRKLSTSINGNELTVLVKAWDFSCVVQVPALCVASITVLIKALGLLLCGASVSTICSYAHTSGFTLGLYTEYAHGTCTVNTYSEVDLTLYLQCVMATKGQTPTVTGIKNNSQLFGVGLARHRGFGDLKPWLLD